MTTINKTYNLPVTLTSYTNFNIDFDKLIDKINHMKHPLNKPDLVKNEMTYQILNDYYKGWKWGGDTFEVEEAGYFEDYETDNDDSYFHLVSEIYSNGQYELEQCYEVANKMEVS